MLPLFARLTARGPRLAELSEELRSLLRGPDDTSLLGVEHEYRILDARGEQVDFRNVVHELRLGRRGLDPDDPFAYRLPSGASVTCDQAEAEIALAPIELKPGFSALAARSAALERSRLERTLGDSHRLEGHSMHLSVSVPDSLVEAVGWQFTRRFAPGLMRLVGSPDRCGVWVRPRAGRLELCLDFVDGDRLQRVGSFTVAAVLACLAHELGDEEVPMPPALLVTPRPVRERTGWHLSRRSVHGDPFGGPHDAALWRADGAQVPAGDQLANACRELRRWWAGHAARSAGGAAPAEMTLADAFGSALRPRARASFELAPVMVTWDLVVYLALAERRVLPRRAFVTVPRRWLIGFTAALDGDLLDDVIGRYLRLRQTGRELTPDGRDLPGLYDTLARRRTLLPVEPRLRRASGLMPRVAA